MLYRILSRLIDHECSKKRITAAIYGIQSPKGSQMCIELIYKPLNVPIGRVYFNADRASSFLKHGVGVGKQIWPE